MKTLCTLTICFLLTTFAKAQSVAINADGSNPDTSAILDVKSATKGFLAPRMTQPQRNAISLPAAGLMIYLTDKKIHSYYTGNKWADMEDKMGDHIMRSNLKTDGYYISKLQDSVGILMKDSGTVSIIGRNSAGGSASPTEVGIIDKNGGFVVKSKLGVGAIPASGAGWRVMWNPVKAAFRAGGVDGTEWNDNNTGEYSYAIGHNCIASEYGAFAGGDGSTASDPYAFSYGSANVSSGTISIAIGAANTAANFGSIALGYTCRALGQGSVAIGYRCSATGEYSVALGYRATSNGFTGCMALGDESTVDSVKNSANNQFAARYAGGYRLYTNSTTTVGASLSAGGNSWGTISDSTKKENFAKADAEVFLNKLQDLRLGSWNYKVQNATYRHYGPMAQEIFNAYGKDRHGIIGCDTILASADMDGIMMILLQGLEKRTTDQKLENTALKTALNDLTKQLVDMNGTINQMNDQLADLKNENNTLKQQLSAMVVIQEQLFAIQKQLNNSSNAVAINTAANSQNTAIVVKQ